MITIFSKKAFRFPNPDPVKGLLSKPKPGEKPEEASARVIGDSSKLGNRDKHSQLFFDTTPGEIQQAPDWIKEDEMFKWAVADGDLMEVVAKTPAKQEAEVVARTQEDETGDEDEGDSQKGAPAGAKRKRVIG